MALSMSGLIFAVILSASVATAIPADCPKYEQASGNVNPPLSEGKYSLAYQRPETRCRTFAVPEVEAVIEEMKTEIVDPDLFRLFENTFPNTLDTTISWKGFGEEDPDEELTFIRTGDINAMWLRDSANQLQSYKPLLRADPSPDSLASLFRGAINLQGRYIRQSPHCNAFQPPPESGLEPEYNSWAATDFVVPRFSKSVVFECKYELDSLAAFLQLSHDYFSRTGDAAFFGRPGGAWASTVAVIMNTTSELLRGTYASDGTLNRSPFLFERKSNKASETTSNEGAGAPVRADTGIVRSFFRPSDDACVFQLFVPANMMFARYLDACADIMVELDGGTADTMRGFAEVVRVGIEKYGRVEHREFGEMYAYEVDGFGSHNLMDDANIPSLLSAPMLGYLDRDDPVYQNTRRFILSTENPYFMFGPVLNATGGPHIGPGMAWPMGLLVQLLTSDDDTEIEKGIRQLLSSTSSLGLIHESVNSHDEKKWTRSWFAWANGLFGQMILDVRERKPHLLRLRYQ
ncbi:related to Meiotically up-regulated gene 157 protein [Cephalotrichum gorgonifer]|uniref:Related to Meiotically up-regulated gene 157 protein n=1 Tax=Cephalotrichum gorgonifer TaxID=2041049 RepID=A0AAE8N2A8_9PEZI|nr:related to Meiotically up-regulated gene 157 protein [Cephalotrichum gorgonifer]